MPEWLTGLGAAEADLGFGAMIGRLAIAAGFGAMVAAIYYLTQRKSRSDTAPFFATLVLLTILLAMVTGVIGNSVARAFGLAGALSIVRFRTVVDDTRDTAFVIFAVVSGMAVGSGLTTLALAGLPVVAATAWLLSWWAGTQPILRTAQATLSIRAGIGVNPDTAFLEVFSRHIEGFRLVSAATVRQGVAIDLTYSVGMKPKSSPTALISELNVMEGVQGVEWKETNTGGQI